MFLAGFNKNQTPRRTSVETPPNIIVPSSLHRISWTFRWHLWHFLVGLAQLNQPSLHDSFPNTSFLWCLWWPRIASVPCLLQASVCPWHGFLLSKVILFKWLFCICLGCSARYLREKISNIIKTDLYMEASFSLKNEETCWDMLLRIGRVTKHLLTYSKNVETEHIPCKLQEKLDCPVLDRSESTKTSGPELRPIPSTNPYKSTSQKANWQYIW